MRKKIYIAIFLILCLVPSALTLILGPSEALSNEIRSAAPRINRNVFKDTDAYISDHFYLRPQMISIWSYVNAKLLNTSSSDKVILGKEDYLFYSDELEDFLGNRLYGDDRDDFMGNHLSDDELRTIAQKLKDFQNSVEKEDSAFIFTVAPNKSTLYGHFMPGKYESNHAASNLARLEDVLGQYDVNYVSLQDLSLPYYATDSHWTAEGAAMVTDALLGTDYSKGEFTQSGIHKGDLYEMLYPSFEGGESEIVYKGKLSYTALDETKDGNAIVFSTSGEGDQNIFVYRDSFGNSLYPFMADASNKATFSRSVTFDVQETKGADIVIIEIVERNLDYLL